MKWAGLTSVFLAAVLTVLAIAACSPKPKSQDAGSSGAASETAAVSMAASDAASQSLAGAFEAASYVGKWTGVKGSVLTIVPNGANYTVTIATAAGSRDFAAVVTDGSLSFVRDGDSLALTKGDGAATGEADLRDKSDCVIVTAGEGYCK